MAERDDGLDKLEKFSALLVDVREQLDGRGNDAGRISDVFDKLEDEAETRIEALSAAFGELGEGIASEAEAAGDDIEQTGQAADGLESANLQKYLEELDAIAADVDAKLDELEKSLQEATDALEEGFDSFKSGLGEVGSALDQLGKDAESAFGDLASGLERLQGEADEAKSQTEDQFEALSGEIEGTFTSTLESAFSEMTSQLQAQSETWGSNLDEMGQALDGKMTSFEGLVSGLVGEFLGAAHEIVRGSIEETVENAQDEIEKAVEAAIKEMIADLVQEIAEMLARATIGSAVTTAIAPYAVPLKAASEVVEKINDLLDALNPLD